VIKHSGILCSCALCKGQNVSSPSSAVNTDLPCHIQPIYHAWQVVTPYYFEVHAGSLKKRPSDYIFLERGNNNLYSILKACAGATLDTLESVIRAAIGSTSQKRTVRCKACKSELFFSLSSTPSFALFGALGFDHCLTFQVHSQLLTLGSLLHCVIHVSSLSELGTVQGIHVLIHI
jgi:hypothetical protein